MRYLPFFLVLCAQTEAFHTPSLTLTGGSRPVRRSTSIVLAEDDDSPSSFSDAFASLAKAAKPQKPGEGAAKRSDVKGLPIRLGGTTRDGSIGSIRAAGKNWEVLKDPRNWQTEEFGLVGVIVFTIAAFAWGYNEYVAGPADMAPPPPSQAALVRQRKLAACAEGDIQCRQEALDSTQAAIENQNALDQCMNYAFGNAEKNICKSKYGAKSGGFGF